MVTINTPKLLIDVYYIENALFTITPSNYTSENYGHTIAIDDRIEDLTPVNISSNPDLYSQMVLDSSRM
jgi:hypothetical protein